MGRRGHHPEPEEADYESGDIPCARGSRCEERDYQGNPQLGPRAFCHTDHGYIASAIRALPRNYAELRLLLGRTGQAEERVSGSREAPIPLAADIEASMREMVHVAASWEEVVRDIASLSGHPDGRRRDSVILVDASVTLERHLETLLAAGEHVLTREASPARVQQIMDECGGEPGSDAPPVRYNTSGQAWEFATLDGTAAGLEFLALNGKTRGMLGLSRGRRRITEVRCDNQSCNAYTLVQYEARSGGWEPRVTCTACPNAYVGPAFELLMGRIYQEQIRKLGKAS